MKLEISAPLGNVYLAGASGGTNTIYAPAATLNGTYSAAEISKIAPAAAGTNVISATGLGTLYTTEAKTPLDREEEIKIAAFQSLLAADPKRAVEALSDVLQPNSKTSETLKIEFVRVLRRPRAFQSSNGEPLLIASQNTNNQLTPLIREALVKSFQKETNVKVRKEIVYTLANIGDAQATEYVLQLYASTNDREIKKAIINSLGYSNSFFYSLGETSPLNSAFGSGSSGNSANKKVEFDKLMEIARTEKDAELRRLAFNVVQRNANWASNPQSVEMVAQMFDAETDEKFKISLVQSLGKIKQKAATDKLLQIARSNQSDQLKLEAIYALRSSKDPEVLRFLENLIK